MSDSLWPHGLDCNPPDSSLLGILQARILERIAIPFSRGSSRPRDWTRILSSLVFAGRIFYHCATWEALLVTYLLPFICLGYLSYFCVTSNRKNLSSGKKCIYLTHTSVQQKVSCWRLISDGWISQSREAPAHNCGSAGDWLMWAWLGVSDWCHSAPHVCCPLPGTNGPAQARSFQSERTNAKVQSQVHWIF